MKRESMSADSLLTSYQVGQLLQVNPSSINKWVKEGRIPAFRTPGGHHRIRAGDLISFLNTHHMPVPRPLANAAKRRLLFVDDDPKQLAGLQRIMKAYSRYVDLRAVSNGIDALVMVGAFQPHVVVLDLVMPNLDGVEITKRLQEMEGIIRPKVILMSARLTPKVEKQALAAGAARVVHKPIDVDVLLKDLKIPTDLPALAP